MDVHFPSCYDPSAGLTDHDNNMAYPTVDWLTGKQNCPDGWLHVPHMFYEMYWDTPAFADRWTPDQGAQPFVLSNGDTSGCGAHGDFLAGWDEDILQHIIDTCNAGHAGMDQCAGITVRDRNTPCTAASPIDEDVNGNLTVLPGNNPIVGFGTTYALGGGDTAAETSYEAAAPATTSVSAEPTSLVTSTTLAPVSPTAEVAETTTTAVTTLPDGNVVITTIVNWVTVTEVVYDTVYKTIWVDAKKRDAEPEPEHQHAHNHMHRHRSPHRERK